MIARIILAAALFFGLLAPAEAQYADQVTFAGTGGGSANAQTITLSNFNELSDVLGVLIKYVPGFSNTGAATLAVSGASATAFRKPTAAGLVALTGGELVVGQPVFVMYDGTNFDIMSVTTNTVSSANLANSALSALSVPVNMQINAAAGSNQLTVSLCSINSGSNTCNNPSATSPLLISFRDATAANGDPVIISLQAALAFTAASTSSFGCTTAVVCRLWVVGINNAGTMALCLFNALSGINVASINEALNQTSQSGTSGGTSAQLYYCSTSSVTGKAIRILGYVEATWVSGTGWSTTPGLVQLFGPGIKKPNDVVKSVTGTTSSQTSCSTNTVTSLTASITPDSAADVVQVDADWNMNSGTTGAITANVRLGRAGTPTFFGSEMPFSFAVTGGTPTVNMSFGGHMVGVDVPSTLSSTTYSVYCTGGSFNGVTFPTYIILKEIMSSLPANDDRPLRMVG